MIQAVFFALLVVALLAGYFASHPASKNVNPVKFMMDNSGYTDLQTVNTKRTQEINMTTSSGIMQMHKQMDNLALIQKEFLNTLQDQQDILKDTSKDAADVLAEAKKKGLVSKHDILQLEDLTSAINNDQRLLVNHGQYLVSLNDQLAQSRQAMSEQLDMSNIITDSSFRTLQQRAASLNNQSADFFDKVKQYNQEVCDQMDRMRDKLRDMADNSAYGSPEEGQSIREPLLHMLDKQDKNMKRLGYSEERNKDLGQDHQEKIEEAKEGLGDSEQQTEDLINGERQKEEDQEDISRQRIEDQRQRMQDMQDDRNL